MATGGERSSFDYDDYADEPGGGRAYGRYVNTDTIQASDSDDDRQMPHSQTEETFVSTDPFDESAAPTAEVQEREGHSSSDEERDASKSTGKMGKLFGKSKKKDGKDKSKEKKDKKEKDDKKEEKRKEKEEKKREKEAAKEKKEKEAKEKKEREAREKEEKERKKKAAKEEKEKDSDGDTEEPKEKKKPRDKSPHRMPAFAKLGFLKRNKKDSNTSTESDIPPPKQTSTPPSHKYDLPPRDVSSEAPHDQTFAQSEHSGGTSAAANSDVFDEPEKVPLEEMDPRMKYGGPPPESIPVPMSMSGEPYGYIPPPMVPVSHAPPVPEDTTAPKTVPYTYKGKQSISDKIRAPINKILVNKRSSKHQQGDGIAELKPQSQPPLVRCSTFIVAVLISGFIIGIILTAMSSVSDTMAVVGPCFMGLSFFGLIGKIFFTLWWEEDPLPPLNKVNSQFHGFMVNGPNYQKDDAEAYPMYPVNRSHAALATYSVENDVTEATPMTDAMQLGPDDVPDIGLRFSDSDMDYALRDYSAPSHEDSMDAYKRMRKDSISSDENVHPAKPSFV